MVKLSYWHIKPPIYSGICCCSPLVLSTWRVNALFLSVYDFRDSTVAFTLLTSRPHEAHPQRGRISWRLSPPQTSLFIAHGKIGWIRTPDQQPPSQIYWEVVRRQFTGPCRRESPRSIASTVVSCCRPSGSKRRQRPPSSQPP